MKVADIMSRNVVTIGTWATISQAAKVMKQHNVRALIVDRTSEGDAYGIITQTDISIAIAESKDPDSTYVYEVMTKPCIVVNPDLSTEYVAKLFARGKIRVAPVIQDRLLGIVSLTDILTKTDCFSVIKKELTQPETDNIFGYTDRYPEHEWEIEDDCIYQNWCSG